MKLLERILLADDFSRSSRNVLNTAVEFAKIFDSMVIPIHVLPDDIKNDKVRGLLNETATTKLDETVSKIADQGVVTGEPILAFGSPHEGVVQAAVRIDANLILVGSGQRLKGDSFKLGTTAERIIQKSEKPVCVVKEDTPLNVRHILCPVDFSETSRQALTNAITMAYRFKAELTILSVCEQQESGWFEDNLELQKENTRGFAEHKQRFDKFLEGLNLGGLTWNKEVRKGIPAEEILGTISDKMVDLLVMGTVGRSGINRFIMGSVTEKVVRELPCSFITIKSEDVIRLQVETSIRDIENHYNTAMQLLEDGYFKEAINQLELCLSINKMYVPAYYGIARVYDKLNEPEKAAIYKNYGKEIVDRLWYHKIEDEVRKFRFH